MVFDVVNGVLVLHYTIYDIECHGGCFHQKKNVKEWIKIIGKGPQIVITHLRVSNSKGRLNR